MAGAGNIARVNAPITHSDAATFRQEGVRGYHNHPSEPHHNRLSPWNHVQLPAQLRHALEAPLDCHMDGRCVLSGSARST